MMTENVTIWGAHVSIFPNVQKRFEDVVKTLLELYLKNADDYAQEKFIKTCAEQIRPIEKFLLYTGGLHPCQVYTNRSFDREALLKKSLEIEKKIFSLVNRMYSNTMAYFPKVKESVYTFVENDRKEPWEMSTDEFINTYRDSFVRPPGRRIITGIKLSDSLIWPLSPGCQYNGKLTKTVEAILSGVHKELVASYLSKGSATLPNNCSPLRVSGGGC